MILIRDNVEVVATDEKLIDKYKSKGFKELGANAEKQDEAKQKPLTKMTVAELQEIAKENNVDVSGLTKKEIIEVLKNELHG